MASNMFSRMDVFHVNDTFTRECNLRPLENSDNLRFSLVGVVGSIVALTSILCNCLVFYIFLSSRKLRRQNYANPVLLAFFDIFVSVCYVTLHCIHVVAYRFRIETMISVWIQYVRTVNCVQHIFVSISNFLLVIASLERLFANCSDGTQKSLLVFMVRRKAFVVGAIFSLATLFKGSLFIETAVLHLPNCNPLESYVPVWIEMHTYWATLRFWVRKICTVLAPFFILFYCNYRIVVELRQRRKDTKTQSLKKRSLRGGASLTTGSIRKHYNNKKGVRVATRTLVLTVGCYLLSNLLSTIVNFWQFFDPRTLESNYYAYLLISDFSTLLTIVGCACRLPIYCMSDKRIRKALIRAMLRCRHRAAPIEVIEKNLEKWSIVVVSNSLRSNLTGANNLYASQDWINGKAKRARDELALLLQNRRRILVDMTLMLGNNHSNTDNDPIYEEEVTADITFLTDIQEEEQQPLYRRASNFKAVMADI